MKYTKIPQTDIEVSKICLGTMTFGEQNTELEGHAQLDFALEKGINFIDTAEMYAVPARKETSGSTEKIIGTWLQKSGKRNQVVLASKIVGPNPGLSFMRNNMDFAPKTLQLALDQSLSRLQTDYLDLYQLHWPERKTNCFGQLGFKVQDDAWTDNIHEVLETLQNFIKQGKVRHIGLSNETPWGMMRFLEESKTFQLPRIKTIQNPYSLLNRSFEVGLAEMSIRENVGLLAYSPLGFGVLTGKFLTGESHPKARLSLFPQYARYSSPQSTAATKRYLEIAQNFGLTLTDLALAFVNQQAFVTANIIGATSLEQLDQNIKSINVDLSNDILMAIDSVHAQISNPAP
ncbi:NADP(H)-dependent aldo-keto reductase [Flavobacterium branchiophilum]|uniref:Protein tas n=1 Tax=Flavobacterium branchiophilum (strain FL-15) TaxID=1034807 RepID=G2Z509_FLABF|nr:NADP(H)-dependent aldo-keto reductase [Flavobacterium branchiophilum]CCB70731.1 Oxidoreductase Tas, aldo/keto reductase family [Flavobacterium branchiophilum FL-15]